MDQFKCKNGYCIEGKRRCNKINDCSDLSDEEDCNDGSARNILFFFSKLKMEIILIISLSAL